MTYNAQSNCNQYRASTCTLAFVYDHHSHAQKGRRSQSPLSPKDADCIHTDLLHREHVDTSRNMASCLDWHDDSVADRRVPLLVVLPIRVDSVTQEVRTTVKTV